MYVYMYTLTHIWGVCVFPIYIDGLIKFSPTSLNVRVDVTSSQIQRSVVTG